jgi:hypothetical protein
MYHIEQMKINESKHSTKFNFPHKFNFNKVIMYSITKII